MKKIVYKDGTINLIDEINGTTMAVTQVSMSPVNLKALPQTAQIQIDKVAFDKMCMDYVRQKGEAALIAAAERRNGKSDAIFVAANSALLGLIWGGRSLNEPKILDECIAMAEKLYDKVDAKKY